MDNALKMRQQTRRRSRACLRRREHSGAEPGWTNVGRGHGHRTGRRSRSPDWGCGQVEPAGPVPPTTQTPIEPQNLGLRPLVGRRRHVVAHNPSAAFKPSPIALIVAGRSAPTS